MAERTIPELDPIPHAGTALFLALRGMLSEQPKLPLNANSQSHQAVVNQNAALGPSILQLLLFRGPCEVGQKLHPPFHCYVFNGIGLAE